jgi:hypothetical protein
MIGEVVKVMTFFVFCKVYFIANVSALVLYTLLLKIYTLTLCMNIG